MTHSCKCLIILLVMMVHIPLKAQVISILNNTEKLPDTEAKGIISDIEDTSGPQQEQFMDWNTTLGNFSEMVTVTQEEIVKKIADLEKKQPSRNKSVKLNGRDLNLPTNPDENGVDLYMLTDEGITIYMALLAPRFYQETTPDIIKWIRYYAYDKRNNTKRMFERYKKWENHIKTVFSEFGVPAEIAELCLIESACTYTATSSAGARGMWQIMPNTARSWGLTVSDTTDERTDPVIATRTAAKILSKTHETIKDWTLCIAAYNCGIGRVARMVKTYGNYDWLKMKKSFPEETQQYIPSMLAIHYVWSYRKQLGLETITD